MSYKVIEEFRAYKLGQIIEDADSLWVTEGKVEKLEVTEKKREVKDVEEVSEPVQEEVAEEEVESDESIIEKVKDVIEDIVDDGKLNNSNKKDNAKKKYVKLKV